MVGGHDEREQTLNQLLAELDGFDPSTGIVLLAATNRPEILDPALLRAGRFDRQMLVDRPDRQAPLEILEVHVRKIKLATGVELDQLAALTTGFTGADLANLVNEAALMATRRRGDRSERWMISPGHRAHRGRAREEEPGDEPQGARGGRLSRDGPRAGFPGLARSRRGPQSLDHPARHRRTRLHHPATDRRPLILTRTELENRIAVLMGGRASEKLVFDHFSTGAADDLAKATDIARSMVMRFGMAEALGQRVYEPQRQAFLGEAVIGGRPKDYSDQTNREIDVSMRQLIDEAYAKAKATLTARREELEQGTAMLLEKETITPEDFPPLDGKKSAEEPIIAAAK